MNKFFSKAHFIFCLGKQVSVVFIVQMIAKRVLHKENFINKGKSLLPSPKCTTFSILDRVEFYSHVAILNGNIEGERRFFECKEVFDFQCRGLLFNVSIVLCSFENGYSVIFILNGIIDVQD